MLNTDIQEIKHVLQMSVELDEIIERCSDPFIDIEDLDHLQSERVVLESQISSELSRLGMEELDPTTAIKRMTLVVKWVRPMEEYGDDYEL